MYSPGDQRSWLHKILLPHWLSSLLLPIFKPTRSDFTPPFLRYCLMHPVGFEVWYRLRSTWFLLTRRQSSAWSMNYRSRQLSDNASAQLKIATEHNFRLRWVFSRKRTEKLMNILRSVGNIKRDSKVLCIGPKNEAEILLLSLYGFKLSNITGIDLFTYSPKVIQMDMHDLQFEDNSFDVVYDSWVLKYAYDLPKACSEIIRVLKNNGIIATGYTQTITSNNLSPKGSELSGGLNDLFYHFEPHVNHVYWQEADPAPPPEGNHRISAIFSVTK